MIAWELHTFRDKQWRIDQVFDDREHAIEAAQRVDTMRRRIGVLVIEEAYDAASNTTHNRTLYRGGRFANRIWEHLPRLRRRLRQPGPQARRLAREGGPGQRPRVVAPGPGPVAQVLLVLAVLLGGLAALGGLRWLAARMLA